MMGYWNGGWAGNMMNWGGFGFVISIFWIVILVDLILLGVWLWQQIQKK